MRHTCCKRARRCTRGLSRISLQSRLGPEATTPTTRRSRPPNQPGSASQITLPWVCECECGQLCSIFLVSCCFLWFSNPLLFPHILCFHDCCKFAKTHLVYQILCTHPILPQYISPLCIVLPLLVSNRRMKKNWKELKRTTNKQKNKK